MLWLTLALALGEASAEDCPVASDTLRSVPEDGVWNVVRNARVLVELGDDRLADGEPTLLVRGPDGEPIAGTLERFRTQPVDAALTTLSWQPTEALPADARIEVELVGVLDEEGAPAGPLSFHTSGEYAQPWGGDAILDQREEQPATECHPARGVFRLHAGPTSSGNAAFIYRDFQQTELLAVGLTQRLELDQRIALPEGQDCVYVVFSDDAGAGSEVQGVCWEEPWDSGWDTGMAWCGTPDPGTLGSLGCSTAGGSAGWLLGLVGALGVLLGRRRR